MEPTINQNRLRQIFFLLVIFFLGLLLFKQVENFLPSILGAITLQIITHKYMQYLVNKRKWKKGLAALAIILGSLLIILIPVGLIVNMITSKLVYAVQHADKLTQSLTTLVGSVESRFDVSILTKENIQKLGAMIAQIVPKIVGATFNSLTIIAIMYFLLYFMLVNYDSLERALYQYIPLKKYNIDRIKTEVKRMVNSNAIGIPVIALAQGVAGLIAYFIAGVNDPFFWFAITCVAAMIPMVGAALAFIPLGIILLADGQQWQGIFIIVYGLAVTGSIDNVLRFTLLRRIGDVHPLITLFGVIIGINVFGFIGLIFGPLLISLFLLLIKIYISEFSEKPPADYAGIEN